MFANTRNESGLGIGTFIKLAVLWFLALHIGTILANSAGLSSEVFPLLAVGGFLIHSLLSLCFVVGEESSSRVLVVVLLCVVVGSAMFASRPLTEDMTTFNAGDAIAEAASYVFGDLSGTNRAFYRMAPVEHLAAAAQLVFEDDSTESAATAQRHLRAITAGSPQYPAARRLLDVARSKAEELERASKPSARMPVVQVLRRELKDGSLHITLRNNGKNPVKNIAYDVLYFRLGTGELIGDGVRSRIAKVLNPRETWTVEVPASAAGPAHAAFSLVNWEVQTARS